MVSDPTQAHWFLLLWPLAALEFALFVSAGVMCYRTDAQGTVAGRKRRT